MPAGTTNPIAEPIRVENSDLSQSVNSAQTNPQPFDYNTVSTGLVDPGSSANPPVDLSVPNASDLGMSMLPVPASGGGASPDFLSSFLTGLTGGSNINIGQLLGQTLPYAAIGTAAQKAASAQQQQNRNTVAPLVNQGNTLINAAQKPLADYQAGNVTPSEQAILDQNAASQRTAAASSLGAQGISDSSILLSQDQQIANNELQQRQQFVEQNLTDALALDQAGLAPLTTAITDTLASDTQIADTMTQLWGSLASAWAKSVAGATSGAGGSGAGGSGSTSNPLSQLSKALTGGSGGIPGLSQGIDQATKQIGQTADQNLQAINSSSDPATAGILADANAGLAAGADTGTGVADASGYGDLLDASGNVISTGTDLTAAQGVGDAVGGFSDALSAGTDAAGTAADLSSTAGDLSSLFGDFSAGSAAAGATDAASAAIAADASATADAALAGSAASGAGLAALSDAGPYGLAAKIAANIALGIVGANQRGPPLTFAHDPTLSIDPNGKLPSGNDVAFEGNVGIGAGNNEAQGSGQLYFLNPNGSYDWLGQDATNQAIQASNYATPEPAGHSGNTVLDAIASVESTNYTNAGSTLFSDLYSSTGGAGKWGESETTWQNDLARLMRDAQGNGGLGLNVGLG